MAFFLVNKHVPLCTAIAEMSGLIGLSPEQLADTPFLFVLVSFLL